MNKNHHFYFLARLSVIFLVLTVFLSGGAFYGVAQASSLADPFIPGAWTKL